MADTAAHLVDRVTPAVPVRQAPRVNTIVANHLRKESFTHFDPFLGRAFAVLRVWGFL
jgi:hypothetical protein